MKTALPFLALVAVFAVPCHALMDDSGGSSSASGGGVTVGDSVSGGTANRLLFEDGSSLLGEDSTLSFNSTTKAFTASGTVALGTTTITVPGSGSSVAGRVNLVFSPSSITGIRFYDDGGGSGLFFDVEGTNYLSMAYGFGLAVSAPGGFRTAKSGAANDLIFAIAGTNTTGLFGDSGQVSVSASNTEVGRFTTTGLKIGAAAGATSTLDVAGSFQLAYTSTAPAAASTYTITSTDYMVTVDATAGARQVDLPTAVGISGRLYSIKKIDASANAVTVATASSQTIDAATTYVLDDQWDVVNIISNGANWLIQSRVAAD